MQPAIPGVRAYPVKLVIDHDKALRGNPALFGATAGTARHSLVLESAMRRLFSYLGALTAPTGMFAAAEDWDPPAREPASRGSRRSDQPSGHRVGRADPRSGPRRHRAEAVVVDFAELLARRSLT